MKKFMPVTLMAFACLTACGASKVTYAEFHEKALAVPADENTSVTVVMKGSTTINGLYIENINETFVMPNYVYSPKDTDTIKRMACGNFAKNLVASVASLAKEDSAYEYYLAGNKFKVVFSTQTTEWNEFGRMTSFKQTKFTATMTYSK